MNQELLKEVKRFFASPDWQPRNWREHVTRIYMDELNGQEPIIFIIFDNNDGIGIQHYGVCLIYHLDSDYCKAVPSFEIKKKMKNSIVVLESLKKVLAFWQSRNKKNEEDAYNNLIKSGMDEETARGHAEGTIF